MKAFLQIGTQSIKGLPPLKKSSELVGAVVPPAAATDGGLTFCPAHEKRRATKQGTKQRDAARRRHFHPRWGSRSLSPVLCGREEDKGPSEGTRVTERGWMVSVNCSQRLQSAKYKPERTYKPREVMEPREAI